MKSNGKPATLQTKREKQAAEVERVLNAQADKLVELDKRLVTMANEVQGAFNKVFNQMNLAMYRLETLAFKTGHRPSAPPPPPMLRQEAAESLSVCCKAKLVERDGVQLCIACGEVPVERAEGDEPSVVLS